MLRWSQMCLKPLCFGKNLLFDCGSWPPNTQLPTWGVLGWETQAVHHLQCEDIFVTTSTGHSSKSYRTWVNDGKWVCSMQEQAGTVNDSLPEAATIEQSCQEHWVGSEGRSKSQGASLEKIRSTVFDKMVRKNGDISLLDFLRNVTLTPRRETWGLRAVYRAL